MKSEKIFYCSFCGKNHHEVAQIITCEQANICNECVLLCGELIVNSHKSAPATANYPYGSMGESL